MAGTKADKARAGKANKGNEYNVRGDAIRVDHAVARATLASIESTNGHVFRPGDDDRIPVISNVAESAPPRILSHIDVEDEERDTSYDNNSVEDSRSWMDDIDDSAAYIEGADDDDMDF